MNPWITPNRVNITVSQKIPLSFHVDYTSRYTLQAWYDVRTKPRRHFWDPGRPGLWSPDFLLRITMESPDSRFQMDSFGHHSVMVHICTYASVHILVLQKRSWIKNACRYNSIRVKILNLSTGYSIWLKQYLFIIYP